MPDIVKRSDIVRADTNQSDHLSLVSPSEVEGELMMRDRFRREKKRVGGSLQDHTWLD